MVRAGFRRRAVLACGLLASGLRAQPRIRELTLAPDDPAARPVVAVVMAVVAALDRRDEAAALALFEPPPLGLSADQVPRYIERRRFEIWKRLKRGPLSRHRVRPIQTGERRHPGTQEWVQGAYTVHVESDADIALAFRNPPSGQSVSVFTVRAKPDGGHQVISMSVLE